MSLNISTVFAIDFLGELLLVTMLVCNVWRLRGHTHEDRLLRTMVACTMVGCVMDSVSFAFDGVPGAAARIMVFSSNTFLYAADIITCSCWANFIQIHMRGSVTRARRVLLGMPVAICLPLLVVNFFVPVVFNVSNENVYSRLPFAFLIIGFSYSYFIYALVLYVHMRNSTAGLRLFPGWALIFPVVVGGSVQLVLPSAPMFWGSVSVGIAATITSLQNEDIYRDKLTGLYNRAFLDYVSSGDMKNPDVEMTGIMIDLNGFKAINDNFGHTVGDQALIEAARIIRTSVGDIGMTARYAGDEFVVLLNTRDETVVSRTMDEIRRRLKAFDDRDGNQYQLSAAMGQYPVLPGKQSVEEFIADIDRAMYEDKKRYYEKHPEANRRK